jgi:PAS domain S-box-containing protein
VRELRSAGEVFRLVVEEATDFAIIVLDAAGQIDLWNAGATAIFGYRPEEIGGKHFGILFTPDDRAAGTPERELQKARETGRAEDARWHLRKDNRLFFADGVTSALVEDGRPIGFVKMCRDMTGRYRAEQRIAAQLALTSLLNEDQPVELTARRIMETVCQNLGWDIGVLWDVGECVRTVEYWHAPSIDSEAARALCEDHEFPRGVGVPGRVWDSGKALWVENFEDHHLFPRAPLAARAGMRTVFAFPITSQGRVMGVMEFFSAVVREPDQALMPVMTLIGAQIGDYIERRRTSQALRESEERYRLVSETAQDAIFTIDEHSRILFCNRAVQQVFGYEPEELVGKQLEHVIPERFREQHRAGMARYLRTRKRHISWNGVELPAVHKDGREFACEIAFGVAETGKGTIFTGFARDISERKRAAEELQHALVDEKRAREETEAARAQLERRAEEESSFRHLASALAGAVEMTEVLYEITNRATLVTRADGVYVERIVNADRTVEVVSSSGRGAPARGLRVSYPGSMTEEMVRNREPVILADMRGFGRSMAPYLMDSCGECQVLVTPLVAENEILGALVLLNSATSGRTFRDSDVVRARTLGDLTSLALRRVRLMEQEREAKEKAEAAVRVRDETLGIVSHDLRNPLTKIALSADLLAGAPSGDQADLVETIRVSAKQMERLIQDLLDVARLEAGRFSVDRSMIDAEPIVRDVCASHEPLAQLKKQKIICSIEGPLGAICADRDRLLQVFGNLIGNAIKFTPERGTITISASRRGGEVDLCVRDSGTGIPDADLKMVFRPYWQAKKTAHMGAGLGLAIVRGIIEAHGGKVWAENPPGGGALFRFTIPAT